MVRSRYARGMVEVRSWCTSRYCMDFYFLSGSTVYIYTYILCMEFCVHRTLLKAERKERNRKEDDQKGNTKKTNTNPNHQHSRMDLENIHQTELIKKSATTALESR